MHILWLVKTVLPQAAAACGLAGASDVSGSWLTGQLAALRPHGELRLTVACTDARQKASLQGEQDGVSYRILPGADGFAALLQTEQPDLVHIWGTEYPEAAAMQDAAAAANLPVLISIQGVMRDCAAHLCDGVPDAYRHSGGLWHTIDKVIPGELLDNMQANFDVLAQKEAAVLGKARCVTGRTGFDRRAAADSGTSLVELIEKAAEVEGIERIRLGSLDPDMLHDEVITRMAAVKKLCPQFHLSLQSGCDKTLRAMRRPYTTAQFADIAAKLRAAFGAENVSFTTDVIVGFPGETEEDFEASMAFVTGQRFLKVHVFPYSRREGTPAYDFPGQLPEHEKEDRSRRMTAAVEKVRAAEVAAMQGRTASVLLETPLSATLFTGYTKQYLPVLVSAPGHKTGDIVNVMLGAWDGRRCRAEIVGK